MDQWAHHLVPARRCVAIDVRCCGQSGDPEHFSLTDAARDLDAVVDHLGLGPVDVLGHSMGGFVAGFYGTRHPESRIVSIDGFGPGMVTVGTPAERDEFIAYQASMRGQFFEMTAAPETGDDTWRDTQIDLLCALYPRIGYTAPNGRAMATRNFVSMGDGRHQRRPPRHLSADAFGDDGHTDILRMYRHTTGPTLVIRCTKSGAPSVLDTELDALCGNNPNITVLQLPLTHLAPAWDALDEVLAHAAPFLGLTA